MFIIRKSSHFPIQYCVQMNHWSYQHGGNMTSVTAGWTMDLYPLHLEFFFLLSDSLSCNYWQLSHLYCRKKSCSSTAINLSDNMELIFWCPTLLDSLVLSVRWLRFMDRYISALILHWAIYCHFIYCFGPNITYRKHIKKLTWTWITHKIDFKIGIWWFYNELEALREKSYIKKISTLCEAISRK